MSEEKKDPGSPENPPPPTVEEEAGLDSMDIKPPVSPRQGDGDVEGVKVGEGSEGGEVEDDASALGSIQDEVSLGDNSVEEGDGDGGGDGGEAGVSFLEDSIEDAVVVETTDEGDKVLGPVSIMDRDPDSYTDKEHAAAVKIQGMIRSKFARDRVREICRGEFEQVFDNENNRYFYFNKKTGASIWEKPAIMGTDSMDPKDEWAATQLQKMYRKKLARKHLADMSKQWFEKAYDPDSKEFYYVRRMDKQTRWDKPPFIAKDDDADLGIDSKKFLDRDEEIKFLKEQLAEKEKMIKHTEKARFQDLEEKLRNERLLTAKQEPRGKQMDEWTMPEVVAWFESLGFPEYEPAIIHHKVDGLLLLNMEEQDWEELGVTSKLHARKIQVNMKKYQIRYENKQNKVEKGEDESSSDEDSGLSDLSISSDPSELLEELLEDEEGEGEEGEMVVREEEEEDVLPPTEEELLEKKRDEENVTIEVIYAGDGKGHPKDGDVVQLHYTCTIMGSHGMESGKVVESSRKMRHRPFEFVVGAGQVIRGWDVAIKQFSFGERSKVVITSKYGYGPKGFPPIIPANSDLIFDLELIKWWKRPVWVKPLIQQPGLSQKPYTKEEEAISGNVGYGDASKVKLDGDRKDDEFSSDSEGEM